MFNILVLVIRKNILHANSACLKQVFAKGMYMLKKKSDCLRQVFAIDMYMLNKGDCLRHVFSKDR